MLKSAVRNPIVVAVGLSVLVTFALAFNLTPWIRGGEGWRWPYEVPREPLRLLPGVLVLVAYLVGAMVWLGRLERAEADSSRRGVTLFGLFCALGGVALQVAFLAFHDSNPLRQLFMRTVSTSSGGFFEVGVTLEEPLAFLRAFPELMPTLSVHPTAHPPGIPLLFWGASRGLGAVPPLADGLAAGLRPYQCQQTVIMALPDEAIAGAALGMALPALSMVALWPLYKLARLLYDEGTALRAVAWWPVVPALVMFVPQWNQFHPALTLVALWALTLGLRDLRWGYFALSGAVMSAATFLSFTNVAILGLLGVYGMAWVALASRRGRWSSDKWRPLAFGVAGFGAGWASLWIVYYAVAGVGFFKILLISLGTHYDLGHPYLPWVLLQPMDFWLFGGLALGVLAAIQAGRGWRDDDALALALGVSVVGLAISGVVRGEVGRLMLWLIPVVVLVAARAVSQWPDPRRPAWVVAAALGLQLVVMVAFLRVLDTELSLPPTSAPRGGTLMASRPAEASFGGVTTLVAFDGLPAADVQALDVSFIWQPERRFDHPAYAGVIVLGPEGEALGVQDWLVGGEIYPTTCWRPGELVGDWVRVSLDEMPPGEYWLSVRLFDAESGEPLAVSGPGLPEDTQVGLGPISVP